MPALGQVFSNDFGLISHGLAGGGLVPSNSSEGVLQAWILSSDKPQTAADRGKWIDGSTWDDGNLWWD